MMPNRVGIIEQQPAQDVGEHRRPSRRHVRGPLIACRRQRCAAPCAFAASIHQVSKAARRILGELRRAGRTGPSRRCGTRSICQCGHDVVVPQQHPVERAGARRSGSSRSGAAMTCSISASIAGSQMPIVLRLPWRVGGLRSPRSRAARCRATATGRRPSIVMSKSKSSMRALVLRRVDGAHAARRCRAARGSA